MNVFDEMYRGTPPWDIGRPQRPVVELAQQGLITGNVLDAGCGTGDNAIFLSGLGLEVLGVDASGKAIELATTKAQERKSTARFIQADALRLARLGQTFSTILDCGLFHTFTDAGREHYLRSLQSVLVPGGRLHLLCFSDQEPDWGGPRRVSREELEETFSGGWWVDAITPVRFANLLNEEGAHAYLGSFTWHGKPAGGVH